MEQPTWPTCQHTVAWEIFVIRIFLSGGMKIEHAKMKIPIHATLQKTLDENAKFKP